MKHLPAQLRALVARLFSLKDTPHAIAGGVAIGIFVGFTPLWGIKTLLSLGLAYLLRCNPIAAVVAVSLHDVITPFAPFLMRLEYDMGYWALSHPHHLPPRLELHHEHFHPSEMLKWTFFLNVGLPLLLGSFFLSTPAALVAYFLMLGTLKLRQANKGLASTKPG